MWRALCLLGLLVLAAQLRAEPFAGPQLGAASNFGQGWQPEMLEAAEALGVGNFRDAVYWDMAEVDGRYSFQGYRLLYPALMAARGLSLSLTVNNGHPNYDAGVTPHTQSGVAAFARFAAAAVDRFPAVDAVEVGNEMNSTVFTSGPMRDADLAGKARLYTALLRETHEAVKAQRPGLRVLGGAAHSIPLAWFRALSEAGAPGWMDAVVVHPYTVAPEQFRRQVALFRQVPGFEAMPIEVTEFGVEDESAAAGYLLRYYSQMALAGVTRAVWYPLNLRGDGLVPLIGADGQVTEVGRTYRLIQDMLVGLPAADVSPDPFTYAVRFGDRALVIWGEPRAVTLADPAVRALGPAGEAATELRLSRDRPLLLLSDGPALALGETVRLEDQRMIADSFHQFAYPGQPGDPFDRVALSAGDEIPFELRDGQERGGVPWTPYLGSARDGLLRMSADWLLPAMAGATPLEIVHRYTAPRAMTVALEAVFDPAARSTDGVVVTLALDGKVLAQRVATDRIVLREDALVLAEGASLEITVGPGGSARGDVTGYRIMLRQSR
jgi:hypothetical protein